MNQEELFDKIDPFLWQLLPDAEREMVEKEIRENADFRAEVAERHFKYEVIKRMERAALEAKIKGWRDKKLANSTEVGIEKKPDVVAETTEAMPVAKTPIIRMTTIRWMAAAAVTIIGIFIVGLVKYNEYKEKQDLIALNQKNQEIEYLKNQAIRDSLAAVALADSLQKDVVKINTSILDIAQSLYSQTAGSSEPKPKKKWLAAFKELEKKQFANVTVAEINDILKEAQPEFDNAKKEDVSQNDLFKFVLLNMLVKPRSTQQEKNLQKWLINFQHKQLNVEQEKYWNQMRQAY
jgi:hypothetical protein